MMSPGFKTPGRGSLRWAAVGGLLLASCQAAPDDQPSDGERHSAREALILASAKVALPPEGVEPGDLPDAGSVGAELLVTYCTPCHALPSPGSHSATDWPRVVRRMWLRAEGIDPSFHVPLPTARERVTLVQYLIDNGLVVSRAALPEGPGRARFATVCSRCHALPDPFQHTPDDWAAVVDRMALRAAQILGEGLPTDDLTAIGGYLRAAARQR